MVCKNPAMRNDEQSTSVSATLAALLQRRIAADGGWWPFDRYMQAVLYTPGMGYYARSDRQFGTMPQDGSDFVTAPELSPLFGRTLAVQVQQALDALEGGGPGEVWEFGAGSGALAAQLLGALGQRIRRYTIVELSAHLRAAQQTRLAAFGDKVVWADTLPPAIQGVVLGNEVLDAMPVKLLRWDGQAWFERGVVALSGGGFDWADQPTALRPPADAGFVPDTVIELHEQAPAFIRTLGDLLTRGAAFFIDYGFPQAEYYHPQRRRGTLVAHRAHRTETDDDAPLRDPGEKDLSAHVDFTGIALAAQDAGFSVIGYTSQARFLFNCGITGLLQGATAAARNAALRLVNEHEMGELFKVIGLARGIAFDAIGFIEGDRTHRL
jgi:SAM-dependent MidA family methyltransferase